MSAAPLILLYEPDAALAAALAFALGLDGFEVEAGNAAPNPAPACLVIDQDQVESDGLALLSRLREKACSSPAVILATNPSRRLRQRIAAAGALLVEKPLLGEALPRALRAALNPMAA